MNWAQLLLGLQVAVVLALAPSAQWQDPVGSTGAGPASILLSGAVDFVVILSESMGT